MPLYPNPFTVVALYRLRPNSIDEVSTRSEPEILAVGHVYPLLMQVIACAMFIVIFTSIYIQKHAYKIH